MAKVKIPRVDPNLEPTDNVYWRIDRLLEIASHVIQSIDDLGDFGEQEACSLGQSGYGTCFVIEMQMMSRFLGHSVKQYVNNLEATRSLWEMSNPKRKKDGKKVTKKTGSRKKATSRVRKANGTRDKRPRRSV